MKPKPQPQIISAYALCKASCGLLGISMSEEKWSNLKATEQNYWHNLALWIHNKVTKP